MKPDYEAVCAALKTKRHCCECRKWRHMDTMRTVRRDVYRCAACSRKKGLVQLREDAPPGVKYPCHWCGAAAVQWRTRFCSEECRQKQKEVVRWNQYARLRDRKWSINVNGLRSVLGVPRQRVKGGSST